MNTLDFFANWFLMFIAFVGMSFLRGWLTAKLGIKGLKMKLTTFREKFLRVPALIKVSSTQVVNFHRNGTLFLTSPPLIREFP